jgi:CheY-like chemotaxis protein
MASKILIVEDYAELRDALTLWLEDKGYEVLAANDGQEGIIKAASLPDLIIADINMPVLDGIEMIKRLRASSEHRHTPILVITGYGMERGEQAIKAGADRALAKPLDPDILMAFVKELLARSNPFSDSILF